MLAEVGEGVFSHLGVPFFGHLWPGIGQSRTIPAEIGPHRTVMWPELASSTKPGPIWARFCPEPATIWRVRPKLVQVGQNNDAEGRVNPKSSKVSRGPRCQHGSSFDRCCGRSPCDVFRNPSSHQDGIKFPFSAPFQMRYIVYLVLCSERVELVCVQQKPYGAQVLAATWLNHGQ